MKHAHRAFRPIWRRAVNGGHSQQSTPKPHRNFLKQALQQLEEKIQQQMAVMQQSNEQLQQELIKCRLSMNERKQAESALHQSQQPYAALVHSLNEIVWEFDLQTQRFLFVSQKAEWILGYPIERWLTEAEFWENHIHPDDRNWVLDYCRQNLQAQPEAIQLEYRMVAADGRVVWLQGIVSVVVEQGQPVQLRGVLVDISDRKQVEAVLQYQQQQELLLSAIAQRIRQSLNLQVILSTTVAEVKQFLKVDRVLMYQVLPNGTGSAVTESVNPGWPAVLGKRFPEEVFPVESQQKYLQGRTLAIADVEQADILPCLAEFVQEFGVKAKLVVPILQEATLWGLLVAHHCSGPRQWQSYEIDLLKQLAAQIAIAIQQAELHQQVQHLNTHLEAQVQKQTAELRQALDFEALLKRITDRVRDSLDESQILQTAVEELTLGLGTYSCDASLYNLEQGTAIIRYESVSGNIPPVQGAIIQLADYTEIYEQLLQGQPLQFSWLSFPGSIRLCRDRFTTFVCPIIDNRRVLGDLWLYRSGEQCFEELEIRLVQQVANQCAIALRQSHLYQAAHAQVTELARLNQLKDDFLSTVSHELRTPMASIKMAAQMLEISLRQQGCFEQEPNQVTRYLQILHSECQREISLINDLLDLSRLDAETEPLILTTIDPRIWIPSIAEPFIERTLTQQQQLHLQLAPDLPNITTDLSALSRVITELLNNACKYTPAQETITLAVQVMGHLQLRITNSGVEIPQSERDRIFDRFYRIPNNDPWKYGGTGLGLALVKKLVKHLHGNICVDSVKQNTTFTIRIPVNLKLELE